MPQHTAFEYWNLAEVIFVAVDAWREIFKDNQEQGTKLEFSVNEASLDSQPQPGVVQEDISNITKITVEGAG